MDIHVSMEQPSPWVARFAPIIPKGAVLDLACGGGRHARLLAELGYPVLAVDHNQEALNKLADEGISTRNVDLENDADPTRQWPFAPSQFKGIIVTNYLHRRLFARIFESLQPGGVLIYETFAVGNEQFGKPSNPHFLLKPGELLQRVLTQGPEAYHVLAFEDGYIELPKPAMVQRICAVKGGKALSPLDLKLV